MKSRINMVCLFINCKLIMQNIFLVHFLYISCLILELFTKLVFPLHSTIEEDGWTSESSRSWSNKVLHFWMGTLLIVLIAYLINRMPSTAIDGPYHIPFFMPSMTCFLYSLEFLVVYVLFMNHDHSTKLPIKPNCISTLSNVFFGVSRCEKGYRC